MVYGFVRYGLDPTESVSEFLVGDQKNLSGKEERAEKKRKEPRILELERESTVTDPDMNNVKLALDILNAKAKGNKMEGILLSKLPVVYKVKEAENTLILSTVTRYISSLLEQKESKRN